MMVNMFSKYHFYCPKCHSQIDEGHEIRIGVRFPDGERGEVYLSNEFGNYKYRLIPLRSINEGEKTFFFCLSCEQPLESETKPNFVELLMRVEKKFDFEVYFSSIFGNHETYVKTENGMERMESKQ